MGAVKVFFKWAASITIVALADAIVKETLKGAERKISEIENGRVIEGGEK